jgi:hypothetical protein
MFAASKQNVNDVRIIHGLHIKCTFRLAPEPTHPDTSFDLLGIALKNRSPIGYSKKEIIR